MNSYISVFILSVPEPYQHDGNEEPLGHVRLEHWAAMGPLQLLIGQLTLCARWLALCDNVSGWYAIVEVALIWRLLE